ncbi:arsenate reductase (glutaredoxin) [Flavobacterium sp.]|jgi:arsenate reductase|uniref:arsenate reductase (glutaredoxin) n=1 Tax=Flavobacterium sp. TaxID=239 RepID=UPI0037C19D4B
MITIYHNPRCAKSREGLCAIEKSNKPFQVRHYMTKPFTKSELTAVIDQLGIEPMDLVRTKETLWIENYKNKQIAASALIEILIEHPKLIERPIIVYNDKAIIARPITKISDLDL